MGSNFEFRAEQARAWAELIAPLFERRGTRTQAAKKLARLEKQSLGSWKTRLSGFTKGHSQRVSEILNHPRRLKCVEQSLNVPLGTLRQLHAKALGFAVDADPFVVLLPGFEDLGPVPADTSPLVPSPQSWTSNLGDRIEIQSKAWPQGLARKLRGRSRDSACRVDIRGHSGSGRTTLLRSCAAVLRSQGETVSVWPVLADDTTVLVVDDFDLVEKKDAERATAWANRGKGNVLLVSSVSSLPHPGKGWGYVACYLIEPFKEWALRTLEPLREFVRDRWGWNIDLTPLRDWLTDDPLAMLWIDSPSALGHLARFVADEGSLPPDASSLQSQALRQLLSRLQITGQVQAAQVIEAIGDVALPALARAIALSPAPAVTLQECAATLVEAAGGISGPTTDFWRKQSFPGMLDVVGALRAVHFLVGTPATLRFSSSLLMQASLGVTLRRSRDELDRKLLDAIVRSNDWPLALVSAAQMHGVGPLLDEVAALPPARLCRAPLFLAYLLALAPLPRRPPAAYRQSLAIILWWHAHVPFIQAPTNVQNEAQSPREIRPLRRSIWPPLCVAIAAMHHRDALPKQIEENFGADMLPEALGRYASLLDANGGDANALSHRLTALAPWQRSEIASLEFWDYLHRNRSALGLYPGSLEFSIWWNHAAAPALLEHEGGWRSLLSTTLLGYAVGEWANAEPWQKALRRARANGPEFERAAWRELLRLLLRGCPAQHLTSLKEAWAVYPDKARGALAALIEDTLIDHVTEGASHIPVELARWIFSDVLSDDALARVWEHWCKGSGVPPWRLFLDCGLSRKRITKAALDRVPGRVLWSLEKIADQDRWAIEALEHLVSTRHLASVRTIARRLRINPWRSEILDCAVSARGADGDRLRASLLQLPEWRSTTLDRIIESGHRIPWLAMMHESAAPSLSEMIYFSIARNVESDPSDTTLAAAALAYADGVLALEGEAKTFDELQMMWETWMSQLPAECGLPDDELDPSELLCRIAALLWRANEDSINVGPILALVVSTSELKRWIGGGMHSAIWALLDKARGAAEMLETMDDERVDPSRLGPRVLAILGRTDLVQAALQRPRLRAGLATMLESPALRIPPVTLRMVCDGLPLDPWDEDSARILAILVRQTGASGLAHVEDRLAGLPPSLGERYWEAMIPMIPDGQLRSRALEQWFALTARR